jgi:glycosyltransferase involved in cell wall biosynthesis
MAVSEIQANALEMPLPATQLRILHVVEAFSTGVFEAVRQIANASARDGNEVHIAHAQRPWTPAEFERLFDPRVEFHRLAWGVQRRPWPLIRGTVQLARLMRREQFDVLHLHSTFAGLGGAIVRPRGVATIYTPHGYMFLMSSLPRRARSVARVLEWFVARRVALIGAVSAAEAANASGLGAPNVTVVHNGIEELDDPPESATLDGSGVVAAGRMSAQRQPYEVARIFARLPAGTPTSWIGDCADPNAAAQLRELGTNLTGWLSREQVLERIANARVYLHWTAWDGHPLSVLEAIGVGTVVVAHDIPPVREILGEHGLCATIEQAAEWIERLLADDVLYASVQRAQGLAAVPFSSNAMTDRWAAVYAGVTTQSATH